MAYFSFVAALMLLLAGGLLAAKYLVPEGTKTLNRQTNRQAGEEEVQRWTRTGTIVGVLVAFIAVTGYNTVKTVENGHIGIVKQFGSLVGTTGEGLVFIAPWRTLAVVSVQNEVKTYGMYDNGENAVGAAVSSDTQPVYMTVAVDYSLERDEAVSLYKITGGDFVARKLDKAVPQITKEVTATYKAVEFARNREVIRLEIGKRLNAAMKPLGIAINVVSLTHIDFTEALKKAIEGTVEAEQLAKKAEAQVAIKKAEAEQLVASANGIAEANIKEAEGEAKANKLREQALTPAILQKLAIETLNPKVQLIYCPPSSVCLPNGGTITPLPTVAKP